MLSSTIRRAINHPLTGSLCRPIFSESSVQKRLVTSFGGSSFYDSKLVGPPELYTEVEKSYEEWKFVEKLIHPEYVPTPPSDPSVKYGSGWKPPKYPPDAEYIVRRTKNHMLPVYLKIDMRHGGQRRVTRIRYVEGNIWALEKEVGEHLKSLYPDKHFVTWVNEPWRHVNILGDYDDEVMQWLFEKGY